MTITCASSHPAHAMAVHPEPERFLDYAHGELLQAPPWQHGVCFNPACACLFAPTRDWQMYCGAACQAIGTAEMRKWGHKMARPLLVWRMGKYNRADAGVIEVTKTARRYVSQVQSAWLADRAIRGQRV